jgi:3-phosphoshikimate 1-carboxyvinyltransferase
MPSATPLTVSPGPPLAGRVRPPGDKSITHRAYLLGLLAGGETVVHGPNPGEDCRATLRCAESLGARVEEGQDAVRLQGTGGRLRQPDGVLDCGNSGTSLRLLAGVLAAQPFAATLTGDESLRRRPVLRVIEPLRRMGATLQAADGDLHPPLEVRGGPLTGLTLTEPTPSAQVAGAILFAGLQARGTTTVLTSWGARDHMAGLLADFGARVEAHRPAGGPMRVSLEGPASLRGCTVSVPGDFSAAAFFLAAAAASPGARVTVTGVGLNPSRIGLLDRLARMGAEVQVEPAGARGSEPVGDVTVSGPRELRPDEVAPEDVIRMLDEVPAWAVAASAARGVSRLRGAAELRVKESDRLRALAEGLRALGLHVEETPDGLDLHGGTAAGGAVRSRGDHRIAMAFAVLGTFAAGPVTVDDASSIATSYPGFSDALRSLGGLVRDGSPAGEGG